MLKISALCFIWNPEICQDPPTCGQDDLVPWISISKVTIYYLSELSKVYLKKIVRTDSVHRGSGAGATSTDTQCSIIFIHFLFRLGPNTMI